MSDTLEDDLQYTVVVNHEEQYSIWPADRPLPPGWTEVGKTGTKADCLAHIAEVWTDMRPLSLRRFMEEAERAPAPDSEVEGLDDDTPHIVDRLSQGSHELIFTARPEASVERLRDGIERGVIFVRFTGTQGGTELGIRIAADESSRLLGELDGGAEALRFTGSLKLDFVPALCHVDLDIGRLAGTGRLERSAPA